MTTFTASNTDDVLALLVASYATPASPEARSMVKLNNGAKAKAAKPSKLAQIKRDAEGQAKETSQDNSATSQEKKAPVSMVELLPVGTYTAPQFFQAIRRAKDRNEEIQAISGYCGFDRYGDFGAQSLAATMKARREINPLSKPSVKATAQYTIAGYVAGMPNELAKRIEDLLGRERLAAESLADQERIAGDNAAHPGDRAMAHTLAQVERERLQQIRTDLAALGHQGS